MTAEGQQPAAKPKPKRAAARVCTWCGTPFVPENKRGPAPSYCKQGCRQRAHEERKRQDEITAIHAREQARLDRIFGTLGKTTAAKARKAVEDVDAEQAGPGPQIQGQEELTW
ncbi:hypothetical protein ACGF0D_42915 [Kitasatospora sp. NPDC048298]|uniref:hypothetical protein n=1 Tax=Kitasatospora sp. NPDC048298 TaxID=3364049 RepID=UPI003712FC2C